MKVEEDIRGVLSSLPGGPTQPEIMAVTLAKLAIMPDDVIAEIGCGTGTVTAALAQKASRVITMDVRTEAIECTKKLLLHKQLSNVEVFHGDARDVLFRCGSINKAFCGGSKGINEIVPVLCAHGVTRIVVNAVLLETVLTTIQALKENNMVHEIVHLQVSRSVELAGRTMFVPIHPVYIITGCKQTE